MSNQSRIFEICWTLRPFSRQPIWIPRYSRPEGHPDLAEAQKRIDEQTKMYGVCHYCVRERMNDDN